MEPKGLFYFKKFTPISQTFIEIQLHFHWAWVTSF